MTGYIGVVDSRKLIGDSVAVLKNKKGGVPAWDAVRATGEKALLCFRSEAEAHDYHKKVVPTTLRPQFVVALLPRAEWLRLASGCKAQGVKWVSFAFTSRKRIHKIQVQTDDILTTFADKLPPDRGTNN